MVFTTDIACKASCGLAAPASIEQLDRETDSLLLIDSKERRIGSHVVVVEFDHPFVRVEIDLQARKVFFAHVVCTIDYWVRPHRGAPGHESLPTQRWTQPTFTRRQPQTPGAPANTGPFQAATVRSRAPPALRERCHRRGVGCAHPSARKR